MNGGRTDGWISNDLLLLGVSLYSYIKERNDRSNGPQLGKVGRVHACGESYCFLGCRGSLARCFICLLSCTVKIYV
jgi:hypothetical protein